MPDTPPATCHTVVSIDAPQYRDEVLAALGIITRDLGLTFTVGEGATLRIVEVTPIPVPGYQRMMAVFNGDAIYIQAHRFPSRYAAHLILLEVWTLVR